MKIGNTPSPIFLLPHLLDPLLLMTPPWKGGHNTPPSFGVGEHESKQDCTFMGNPPPQIRPLKAPSRTLIFFDPIPPNQPPLASPPPHPTPPPIILTCQAQVRLPEDAKER